MAGENEKSLEPWIKIALVVLLGGNVTQGGLLATSNDQSNGNGGSEFVGPHENCDGRVARYRKVLRQCRKDLDACELDTAYLDGYADAGTEPIE